jgi:hypothetical protein
MGLLFLPADLIAPRGWWLRGLECDFFGDGLKLIAKLSASDELPVWLAGFYDAKNSSSFRQYCFDRILVS